MNNTYYDIEQNKFIISDKIKIENQVSNNNSVWGKLWQYMMHASESKICLKMVKYIRKNKNRIRLIGVDNDKLDRDYDMYKIIIKNIKKQHINFFWGHNDHIDSRKLSLHTLKYIKNKHHKYTCGYYLKKKLKDRYCIILSTAYGGINRFNGYCIGEYCYNRIWQLKYFYKRFIYVPNKKYINKNKKEQLLNKFDNKFIEFSNSCYKKNKCGCQRIVKSNTWDFVLFWTEVSKLPPYYEY